MVVLIGGHSTSRAYPSNNHAIILAEHDVAAAFGSTNAGGAVFHLARLLAKGKCLCAIKLGTLAKLVHATLASGLMFLRIHAKVVLREAARTVRLEKITVAAVQNVHLRIRQLGIAECIDPAILVAHELGPSEN